MIFFWMLIGCGDPLPTSDADCVTFYDTCNAGCTLQCGTIYEKESVESAQSCDLGCVAPDEIPECILSEDTCAFAPE